MKANSEFQSAGYIRAHEHGSRLGAAKRNGPARTTPPSRSAEIAPDDADAGWQVMDRFKRIGRAVRVEERERRGRPEARPER